MSADGDLVRIAEQRGIIEEHAVTIAVQYRNLRAAEADLLLAAQQNTRLSEKLDRCEACLACYEEALREIAERRLTVQDSDVARDALAESPGTSEQKGDE